MKFLRYGPAGSERPACLDQDGHIRDLGDYIADLDSTNLGEEVLGPLNDLDLANLPLVDGNPRIGPCVARPGKLICIGLNYSDHAAEAGMEVPSEPVIFFKATSAICGPNDPIEIPRGSKATDWEVELGVVIGKRAKYVSEDQAMQHIAGYCAVNDISERDFQLKHSGQWVKGKSHDSFAPLGPWLVSRDEIEDPHRLSLCLSVNGRRFQDGSTETMVYQIPFLISYLSRFMTLEPGDIISTGTPPGVGMGQTPPTFLKPGDQVELSIEGLGSQKQVCREATA